MRIILTNGAENFDFIIILTYRIQLSVFEFIQFFSKLFVYHEVRLEI